MNKVLNYLVFDEIKLDLVVLYIHMFRNYLTHTKHFV